MVKSKKMSKTSIAVIVLAILLVLSMVMGLTGAWFTAKQADTTGKTLNFGEVALGTTVVTDFGTVSHRAGSTDTTYESGVDIMPGDTVHYDLKVVKGDSSEDFYYIVIINVVSVDGTLTLDSGYGVGSAAAVVYNTLNNNGTKAENKDGTVAGSFELDGDYYNDDWQGKSIKITWEVRAIQMANLTAAEAEGLLRADANWAAGANEGANKIALGE